MVQSTNAPALVSSGFKRRQAQRAAQVCRCGVQGARTRLLPLAVQLLLPMPPAN
jgi:hypothetical protein